MLEMKRREKRRKSKPKQAKNFLYIYFFTVDEQTREKCYVKEKFILREKSWTPTNLSDIHDTPSSQCTSSPVMTLETREIDGFFCVWIFRLSLMSVFWVFLKTFHIIISMSSRDLFLYEILLLRLMKNA